MRSSFDHHGLSFSDFKSSLSGGGQANCVQQALLANMVRASGSVEEAWRRDAARNGDKGRQQRGRMA